MATEYDGRDPAKESFLRQRIRQVSVMNVRWKLVLFLLGIVSPLSSAAEPGPAKSWKQKAFIITAWAPPPAEDKVLAAYAGEHYNLIWISRAEELDVAAKHRLRAMLTNVNLLHPATMEDPAKRKHLDEFIKKVKDHPALEAYYITDEPSAGSFPGLAKLVAYLRERDPAHFAYINLYPTYAPEGKPALGVTAAKAERARIGYPKNLQGVGPDNRTVLAYREYLKQFVEIVKPDLISYDHYHFMKTDGDQYFLNLALIRLAAEEAKRPFLNIIQAGNFLGKWRQPNAREMRFLVFTTMAYGGRGISYFTYWGPKSYGSLYQDSKRTPLAKDVAVLNAEIGKIGSALMMLDSVGVYHTAPLPYGAEAIPANAPVNIKGTGEFVLGLFGKAGRATAFMVVNRSYKQEAQAVLKVAIPGKKLQELDRKTGEWSDGESLGVDRTMKTKLSPGDGRLFRVIN